MQRSVTAGDVARKAGVSAAAVSRAFRSGSPMKQETRAHILRVARTLCYVPPSRRGANSSASSTVTVIAGDLTNPFYPDVIGRLSRVFHARGRRVILQTVAPDEDIDTLVSHVLEFRTDAVILTSATLSSTLAQACRNQSVPVVLFNRLQIDPHLCAVTCDNYGGGLLIGRRFHEAGRRRIAMIGGTHNASTQIERRRGFLDALAEAGIAPIAEVPAHFTYDSGLVAARHLLSGTLSPDAVFCCNDVMALAAIDAARERGLRVPEDIAIIGFDDIPMSAWTPYQLTTVRQPVNRMVNDVADLVELQLADPKSEGSIRIAPVRIVERSSG